MLFEDRRDAGRELARMAATLPNLDHAIVLGLPRGGVPVAFEVARALHLPLDILMVRKLGAPGQRELALGAVASGGGAALNDDVLRAFNISEKKLSEMVRREREEIARREREYRGARPALEIEGTTAILVDDGLATGASMKAAARAVRGRARRVVIAVPVAALSSLEELESEVDATVCVAAPEEFEAVGQFYRNFEPTSDEEVRRLLAEAYRESISGSPNSYPQQT